MTWKYTDDVIGDVTKILVNATGGLQAMPDRYSQSVIPKERLWSEKIVLKQQTKHAEMRSI